MNYVIIGGGIAGVSAAEELRKHDSISEITIISEEQHPLYSRVLLGNYVKGKIEREKIFLKKDSWYEQNKIEYLIGLRVENIDTKNKFVELGDSREISFDILLIASGCEVKMIDEDLKGVAYLRTLDDADHLIELLKTVSIGSCACIYGGGFVACEYLNIFKHFNLPTTVIVHGDYFWSSQLCKQAGEILNQHLENQGVKIITSAVVTKLIGEKTLTEIETTKGNFPCSILGVGVGVEPEFSFVKSSEIKINKGILCDEHLQTNISGIFVAGDVAEYFDNRYGRNIRIGNWMNATMQGRLVAKNMMGEKNKFDLVSSHSISILGLDLIFVGDTDRKFTDSFETIGSKESGGITEVFVRNGKPVGAIIVGRSQDRTKLTRLIQDQMSSQVFNAPPP